MFTGFLMYVERVRPGWIEANQPSVTAFDEELGPSGFITGVVHEGPDLVDRGQRYCSEWADVAHGEAKLGSIDRDGWVSWRDIAVYLTARFRHEFDPTGSWATTLKDDMSFEDACVRLSKDEQWDPMGLAVRYEF
jgi:hypothetical protein